MKGLFVNPGYCAQSLSLLIVCFLAVSVWSQNVDAKFPMRLLPGYHVTLKKGIDSAVGDIAKKGGVAIRFEMMGASPDYSEDEDVKKNEAWRKIQTVNGNDVVCIFSKQGQLLVSFPKYRANFFAQINTEQDAVDMMLMVLTFQDAALNQKSKTSPSH